MDQLPAPRPRKFIHLVDNTAKEKQPKAVEEIVDSEETTLGRPIRRQTVPVPRRNSFRFFLILVGAIVVASVAIMGLVNIAVVRAFMPNSEMFSNLSTVTNRQQEVLSIVTEINDRMVRQEPEFRFSPDAERRIEEKAAQTVEKKMNELGLVLAKNSPIIRKLEGTVAAQQRMIDDLSRNNKTVEAKLQKVSAEKSELVDRLDLAQQKLENSSTQVERDQILQDAVANLSREDIEALMLYEKIQVKESAGHAVIYGPWVQMKIWVTVQKKDWKGAPLRDEKGNLVKEQKLINKPGPFNPWIKVVNGIGFDRAYGPVQMMGENIPTWSEEATGIRYTPELLMKEPGTYRKVAIFQIKKLLKQYNHSIDDVLSVWHSGRPLAVAKKYKLRDVNMGTTDYVKHVKSASTTNTAVWNNARP